MKLRPVLAAVLMAAVSVGAAGSAHAAPKKKKPAPKLAPIEAAPASTPDAAGGEAAPAPPAEEPPPDEKTMEGVDENPGAPKEVEGEKPVVVAPPPRRTGYPIEEVLRPLTLPEQAAEVALDLRANIKPTLSGILRARYGITREGQIGIRYVLGTAFDPDGDTGAKGMEFRAGKAVALDGAYQIQDWVAAQVAVPLYFQPSAVGLVLGAPVKFRFGDKLALFGLNDLVEINLYHFVPSLVSEQDNVDNADKIDTATNTIIPDGQVRVNAGAIVQLKPEVAVIGQAAVIFPDFSSIDLIYPLEAIIQYSISNKVDLAGRLGFDDLSDGESFGVRVSAIVRI